MAIGVNEIYNLYVEIEIANKREPLDRNLFKELLSVYCLEASDLILNGFKQFSFGYNTGNILIKTKPVYNEVIDWEASFELLTKIAKEFAPHVLDKYPNGVNRKTFPQDMSEYVYDAVKRPNAPKWLVRKLKDKEDWWHWEKKYCTMPNTKFYSFRPTGCCNFTTPNGTHVKFSELYKYLSIGEIKFCTMIGNKQKKNLYKILDPAHTIKYTD